MYCTPCARLMKSITPNTRVSPAATRNSSTPNCRPFRACTRNSPKLIRGSAHPAFGRPGVGVVLQHLAHGFGLELAVGAPGHLAQPEILHGVVVGAEFEVAADGAEIRGADGLAH